MTISDPRKHRHSIRLKGYDYAQAGAYFITIVAQDRACVFGRVVNGEMRLNPAGDMVWGEWNALPDRFPSIELDAFVVMPNHVHGIIVLTNPPANATVDRRGGPCARPSPRWRGDRGRGDHKGCPYGGGCGWGV